MDLKKFKETLLEFLSDVTNIPEKSKNWFLDKPDAKELFDAPLGYKVFSPFVLVKVQTTSHIPDRPKPQREEGQEETEEPEPKPEVFHCIVNFRVFTESNRYSISAVWKDYHAQYLGCMASTRMPRAGEDWGRGNDLPDGHFCRETWERIKNAIIRYEVEGLSKYIVGGHWTRPQADKLSVKSKFETQNDL